MNHFLVKSEPSVYSWDQFVKDKSTFWSGVRNHQAAANMKAMRKGDLGFFYHSNEGKEIVGLCEVTREYYPDHTDQTGKFGMVDLKPVKPLPRFVTLAEIKSTKGLEAMALIKQSRLSVCPVSAGEWAIITKLGGL
jgi:predicted RNA-binding protein with PUA-like domain